MLESCSSTDGQLCVDFFRDPQGGFGFEHFRAEPEDPGRWVVIGNFGGQRYRSPFEAIDAANEQVAWLSADARPRRALEAWRDTLLHEPDR